MVNIILGMILYFILLYMVRCNILWYILDPMEMGKGEGMKNLHGKNV